MFKSLLRNNFIFNFIPKGKAWEGKNLTRLCKVINDFWILTAGLNTFRYQRNQFVKTADSKTIDDYFNTINNSPRIFSSALMDKKVVISLFKEKRKFVTVKDWQEIATKLRFALTIYLGTEVFHNPELVAPTPPPTSERNGKYIIYIKIDYNKDDYETLPYAFDFRFPKLINPSNLFDIFRVILNNNVELRSF